MLLPKDYPKGFMNPTFKIGQMIKGAAIYNCAPFFILKYFAMHMINRMDLALDDGSMNAEE